MYINLLDVVGIVSNKEICLRVLRDRCRKLRNVNERKIAYKVNENYDEEKNRYFSEDYSIEYPKDEARVRHLWVDSGFFDKNGDTLFLQFGKSSLGWQGCFVGTTEEIKKNGRGSVEGINNVETEIKNDIVESVSNEIAITDELCYNMEEKPKVFPEKVFQFYTSLYNRLLIQTGWELTKPVLRTYIETLISRINNKLMKKEDCSDFLIYNKDKTQVIYNSALLDKFGKSILIINTLHKAESNNYELSYTKQFVVESKSMLINQGFSKSDITGHLERVPFYNVDVSELIFTADIDDFDLENWDRLNHCICERRDRFPEKCDTWSDEAICSDLVKAIELGVKLSKYDSSYVKPIYNRRYDKVHFIIPYHVGNNFTDKVDLGIVVAMNYENDLWQVMTILDKDRAHNDIKALSIYSDNSL